MKYFTFSEFDSPLEKGSGERMQPKFLEKLDKAREIANIPFKITSGYRVPADIERLAKRGYKVSKNSSHLKGVRCGHINLGFELKIHHIRCTFKSWIQQNRNSE